MRDDNLAQCKKSVGKISIFVFDMGNRDKKDISLVELILPGAVFEHFDVVDVFSNDKQIDLFLDEKFVMPTDAQYTSKGFTEQSVIQDFRYGARVCTYIFGVASGKTISLERLSPTDMI